MGHVPQMRRTRQCRQVERLDGPCGAEVPKEASGRASRGLRGQGAARGDQPIVWQTRIAWIDLDVLGNTRIDFTAPESVYQPPGPAVRFKRGWLY